VSRTLILVTVSLALSACVVDATQPDGTPPPSAVPPLDDGVEEAPLVTDADLDSARPLPATESSLASSRRFDLPLTNPALVPRRDNLRTGARPTVVESLFEALEPKGRIAYVQSFEFFGFSRTWLRLVTVRDFQFPARLIYRGDRPIDSVAVSEDGKLVAFSTTSAAGDFDVFLLDLDGSLTGEPRQVFALPGTPFDETNVSMSLDGGTLAWQSFDETDQTANYVVGTLDRETGNVAVTPFSITLGGTPIEQTDPSLTGNGEDVYFVAGDDVAVGVFGAPIIVQFSTIGLGGAVAYAGVPEQTTALRSPSADIEGERLLFVEETAEAELLVTFAPIFGEVAVLEQGAFDHPYLTADGTSYAFASDGAIFKAEIDFDDPEATEARPIPDLPGGKFPAASPFWAQAPPPPPPPPPGTIIYEGTTVGLEQTFQRPEGAGPGLADGDFLYDAFEFSTDSGGLYVFLSEQDYDGYVHLYEAPFDPTQPLVNLVAGNDDTEFFTSGFSLLLPANTNYVLVTSSFLPGDSGTFTNTITPPQIPASGEAPVVQLFEESVRVAEPGDVIQYDAFVASTDAIACEFDYGDGTIETVPCAPNSFASGTHAYAGEGFFTVTVTATSAGGSDSASAFPTIAQDDPNGFDIVVVFGNDQLSPAQKAAFQGAADRWARAISGDIVRVDTGDPALPPDLTCSGEPAFNGFVDDVVISAVGEPIDGPGAVLGSAGPCLIRDFGTNGTLIPLPLYGTMRFDIADLDGLEQDGSLEDVIVHEMGHVIGIGTLWEANGIAIGTGGQVGDPAYDPQYIGASGVEQYNVLRAEAGLDPAESVPLANTGGGGTTDSHWREATFDNELMTGFLNEGVNPISVLTVGQLGDLGYEIDLVSGSDPYSLPEGSALMSFPTRGYDVVQTLPKKALR